MLEVAGRPIAVTSPDKVFFSERGETKLDLARYYLAVAEPFVRAAATAAARTWYESHRGSSRT